jgi:hypothetical protein
MIGCGRSRLNRKLFPQSYREFGNKGRATVRNDRARKAEDWEHYSQVVLNEVIRFIRGFAWYEDFEFGKIVHNYQHGIEVIGFR